MWQSGRATRLGCIGGLRLPADGFIRSRLRARDADHQARARLESTRHNPPVGLRERQQGPACGDRPGGHRRRGC